MLSKEELLIDRFKISNIWPDMWNYRMYQGQIIELKKLNSGGYGYPTKGNTFYKSFFENYPHLFQPLPWWSDRKPEDLPRYIKGMERVYEVAAWRKDIIGWPLPMNKVEANIKDDTENSANIEWHFFKDKFLPATLTEYEAFNQKK